MPISREEYESGHLDLTVPIRQLLMANSDFAFTAQEIQQRLEEVVGRLATESEVAGQLDQMVKENTVGVRELGGQRWYIIIQPEGPESTVEK